MRVQRRKILDNFISNATMSKMPCFWSTRAVSLRYAAKNKTIVTLALNNTLHFEFKDIHLFK